MSEHNKLVPRRALEALVSRGDLNALDELFASDFIGHDTSDGAFGRDAFRQGVVELIDGFSDRRVWIEDQFVDGDKVVTRWKATGTHSGAFRGMAATGRQITIAGISIDRIVAGKIVESWEITDDLGVMRQLGLISDRAVAAG